MKKLLQLNILASLFFIGLSGCVSTASSSLDNGNKRHVDGVSWSKQANITPEDVLSSVVASDETRLVFIRNQDNYLEQTRTNISVNNRFQVSLHAGGYTVVKSCVGINQLSSHATGYKDNNLLANKKDYVLEGGQTYYFLVSVKQNGQSEIKQLKSSDEALELLNGKRYQTHQISRVVPNCPTPVINVELPVIKTPALAEEVTIDLEVLFETDKSVVRPSFYKKITEVAEFMTQYPNTIATIEGHTDSRASDKYNLALSQRRADAVRSVLIDEFGIDSDRLSAIGYGESRPRASNETVNGRQLNRRVVAVIEER